MPEQNSEITGQITYADAGVDIEEGARAVQAIKESVHSTYRDEVVGDIGGFGGLFSIARAKAMDDPLLVSGTDGVGTKLQVATLCGIHNTIGIDLVAMCVNDILATGAEPLFFLDYIAIGKLESAFVASVVEGIAEGCRQAGCALIGGEMAEHPGVMAPTDYDLSGFCVGLVDRPKMLDPAKVVPGDVLIGLPSSGLHSNGFSLARKVCLEGVPRDQALAPVDELDGRSVAEALLAPTVIYVRPVLGLLQRCPGAVHALAHITGGGITENLNRALNGTVDALVELGSWSAAPILGYTCAKAHLSEDEALKTFNMGIGMVLVVAEDRAEEVLQELKVQGSSGQVIGRVVEGGGIVRYENRGALLG